MFFSKYIGILVSCILVISASIFISGFFWDLGQETRLNFEKDKLNLITEHLKSEFKSEFRREFQRFNAQFTYYEEIVDRLTHEEWDSSQYGKETIDSVAKNIISLNSFINSEISEITMYTSEEKTMFKKNIKKILNGVMDTIESMQLEQSILEQSIKDEL